MVSIKFDNFKMLTTVAQRIKINLFKLYQGITDPNFFVYVVQVVGFDWDFILFPIADLKGCLTLFFSVAVSGLCIL